MIDILITTEQSPIKATQRTIRQLDQQKIKYQLETKKNYLESAYIIYLTSSFVMSSKRLNKHF